MVRRGLCSVGSLAILLLFPGVASSQSGCDHLTATGNAEYPPYLWRDPDRPERLIGANADLIQQLGTRLGLQIDVVYVGPWSRAQEEVKAGRVDMLAGYFLTKERERTLDFIDPPFLFTPSMVWVRKDGAFAYHQWADLIGHSGGTLVNNSYGQAFDDYASEHLSLEAVPTASQAFQKLMLKRNDFVIFEQYPGIALAKTLGIDSLVKALEPPVSSEGLYLALSPASRCLPRSLRDRISDEMSKIVASPLPQALVDSNLARWSAQQQAGLNP
ncbi:transporter substrate-binding domain-containing protein [Pseudomonas sp. GD03842]|uniref:substrate-binding periplasmic protein n=1 Tax=unclassified Pseudomonas TaxID=196821 RepID=UPI000D359992|nr:MULTISPECIES: transporter substrate-binding domain-containing protein [unclassified Pseudomonas]MDH0746806.1 transporter substrate-binding domain-containing protein [Pseudomonas sp. GD03842]RAU45739.1 amino acid ABC transporter substrate-binding protein [Pseudomonas sp. RIT 409]RAU56163.1 amino acid ABC transporter substrate-binding protein [Pseudomonas sp. RIT 412]